MLDKSGELTALTAALGDLVDLRFEAAESPDFIGYAGDNPQLGVEVTEFYFSETEARKRFIPGYTEEVMETRSYRHKDDAKRWTFDKITIRMPGKEDLEVEALISEAITPEQIAKRLLERIKEKNAKVDSYLQQAPFADLVIDDVENICQSNKVSTLLLSLSDSEDFAVLLRSPFDEVFFLTQEGKSPCCIPLRASLIATEAYTYELLYRQYQESIGMEVVFDEYYRSLGRHLVKRCGKVLYSPDDECGVSYHIGATSVGYNAKAQIAVGLEWRKRSREGRHDAAAALGNEQNTALQEYIAEERHGLFAPVPITYPTATNEG